MVIGGIAYCCRLFASVGSIGGSVAFLRRRRRKRRRKRRRIAVL